MNYKKSVVIALFLAGLTACTSYQPVQLPVRDADLYPNSQMIAGLSVAVDEISNPERVRQYFGVDLTKEDILPVMIIISNRGDDRFVVKPSDVLLLDGNGVIDPMPVETVGRAIKGGPRRLENLEMKETMVRPDGNYQGMLFFKTGGKNTGLYSKVEKLFTEGLTLRVAATDQETGERVLFGPFPLSGL